MKKIFTLFVLGAMAISVSADTFRYKCGITEIKVDTLSSTSKNQFTVTFSQKCKNTAEYTSKPEKYYESQIKLVLNSDDRTLDGVYTTDGASTTSSSSNVNDQTINLITSEFTSGSTSRVLCQDRTSTFVINKEDNGQYSIGECTLYFTQRVNKTNVYIYEYSYNADEILTQGIGQTPFVFGYTSEYQSQIYNYDMSVTGLSVRHENSAYDATRYFLTLQCTGINRENSEERSYEVELAIYPNSESIAGTYATQGTSTPLMAMDSYVKDNQKNKTRYLANDSISSIRIKDKGNKNYSFYGGTLICTDSDMNYLAVYGKKRIEAVHYYHFSDNDGEGISFGYDEETGESGLTTGIEDVLEDAIPGATKMLREGRMVIERKGVVYTMQGAVVQ